MAHTRHARFVVLGKRGLIAASLGLLALLILLAWWDSDSGTRLSLTTADAQKQPGQAVMQQPRYHGLDEENRPYTIWADQATQVDAQSMRLDRPEGKLELKDDGWIALQAGEGMVQNESKQLALSQAVTLRSSSGYVFKTDHAQVDMSAASVLGDAPVAGEGPSGNIEAERFAVDQRGQRIRFDGNVHVTLNGKP